jgi:hypothetical protein
MLEVVQSTYHGYRQSNIWMKLYRGMHNINLFVRQYFCKLMFGLQHDGSEVRFLFQMAKDA